MAAKTPTVRAEGFHRRAGRFITSLYSGLNGETYTAVPDIQNEMVQAEDAANLDRTVNILVSMGYVETGVDDQGRQTLRLTPSGVVQANLRVSEE